jgi:hypothetical protein
LPQGRSKFVVGQKIDSIELRATKMAANGEGAVNWKPDPNQTAKSVVPTDHLDKGIRD